ncbi:MAG: UDP-N-acetylmuramoyl-tripeptide--D-alanyl-D-alanine ligase, partial [Myxococcota bacterium]|nr:UDP-N-acetylmuramoyl-tripeptide--D-alanyl-D-alanine ligase [Myxococcota bacterium]
MNSPFAPPFRFDGRDLPGIVGGELRGEVAAGRWRVTTDSRLATADRLFIALAGERFDGHDFVAKVLEDAATGAVVAADHPVARIDPPAGRFLITVDDPLRALGALAAWVRASVSVPVLGLTGSSGKTTTKEMIAAVMSGGSRGLATQGNLNNEIGLPLTLLHWQEDMRWMALEMGMSAAGEIRRMAEIAQPTIRLITNVAPAHLENFADLEAVAGAKGELFEGAHPGDLLVSNADDPLAALFPRPEGAREIRFGTNPTADVRIVKVEPRGDYGHRIWLSMIGQELVVDLGLPGRHNVENVAAAAAVTWAAGVPLDSIVGGLENVRLPAGRMAALTLGDVLVFDDSYNANPRSMKAALRTLTSGSRQGRCVAV